jgi:hypothetical protein
MKRLISALVACLLGLGLMPSIASAARDKGDVYMIDPAGVAMVPGQSGWTGVVWKAGDDDLTEFSVTVSAPSGWGVTYPENRVTDTSLWDNDTLSAGEVDFTAFRLAVPENTTAPSTHSVEVYVSYSYLKNGRKEKVANKRYTLTVPVVAPANPAITQETTSLGEFAADSQTWVDVLYRGRATAFDFQLTVTDPAGAAIIYPGDGTFSSLNGDSVLEVDETDRASFMLDTTGLALGTYAMQTNVSYRVATQAGNLAGIVTFEVVAPTPATGTARVASKASADGSDSTRAAHTGQSLVEVEARRLCDVSKMTFPSADAMAAQLARRVTDAGYSMETYDAWRARLSKRPLRRAKVYSLYRSMCGLQNPGDDANATS